MASRKVKPKVKPPWDMYFYIAKLDVTVMYLYVVKSRNTRKQVAGGWTERSRAINWLNTNWKTQLEIEIENILLVDPS